MSNRSMVFPVLICAGTMIGDTGCRSKQPAAAPNSKTTDSKTTEGPILVLPQQQSTPATPQSDHAALPTEGEPDGKVAANGTKADITPAAQPTEGDLAAKANPSDSAKLAGTDAAEAAKIRANLALLSTTDRELAEKQKICPVSGEPLGAMGAPKKITVAGREVFICCPSCEDPLNKEPAKFLAKIGLQPAQ